MKNIIKAEIRENIPYCNICGSLLKADTTDYKSVEIEGKRYTEFIKRCSNEKCGKLNQYCCDIEIDYTRRFVVNDDDMVVIESEIHRED